MSDVHFASPPSFLREQSIVIVGAGPAGLTVARLLQMRGIEVAVYEREASASIRSQGGSLDLHADSGQRALQAAGLYAEFARAARPDGQLMRIADRFGTLLAEESAEDQSDYRPEIDRGALRQLLLASLKPGTVRWGHSLRAARQTDRGLELDFGSRIEPADIVFGCDGGWSRLRPLVSDTTSPTYTGAVFIQSVFSNLPKVAPELARRVGTGSYLALGEGKGLLAQRNGDGTTRLYVALKASETWLEECGIDFNNASQSRSALLALFDGWAPVLRELLERCDDWFQPWPLFTYASQQHWMPHQQVTLLGDAAHLMPPFTGRGANMAMLDALTLTEALCAPSTSDLSSAIMSYETQMLARMESAIEETLASQNLMLAQDSPQGLLKLMRGEIALDSRAS